MQAQTDTLHHCEEAVQKIASVPGGHLYQQFPYNDPSQNRAAGTGSNICFSKIIHPLMGIHTALIRLK